MEVILRVAAFLLKCLGFVLTPLLGIFNPYNKVKIPPNKNELLNIPVVDLAQKIRKKEVHTLTRIRNSNQRALKKKQIKILKSIQNAAFK